MIRSQKKRVTLNLDIELKSGQTEEEFYCFLSYTLKYFARPEDVERFKQQYLPKHLLVEEIGQPEA